METVMTWKIRFYSNVDQQILSMPPKIQARMLRILELMEKHGANIGPPHTESIGDGLFEIRAKAQEGIGRSLFCYLSGKQIVILHSFIKKSQKTPRRDIQLAQIRQKEVKLS